MITTAMHPDKGKIVEMVKKKKKKIWGCQAFKGMGGGLDEQMDGRDFLGQWNSPAGCCRGDTCHYSFVTTFKA